MLVFSANFQINQIQNSAVHIHKMNNFQLKKKLTAKFHQTMLDMKMYSLTKMISEDIAKKKKKKIKL